MTFDSLAAPPEFDPVILAPGNARQNSAGLDGKEFDQIVFKIFLAALKRLGARKLSQRINVKARQVSHQCREVVDRRPIL
jgi:hypothetical protein